MPYLRAPNGHPRIGPSNKTCRLCGLIMGGGAAVVRLPWSDSKVHEACRTAQREEKRANRLATKRANAAVPLRGGPGVTVRCILCPATRVISPGEEGHNGPVCAEDYMPMVPIKASR